MSQRRGCAESGGFFTRKADLVANLSTAAPSRTDDYALHDYRMRLMLVEQPNKERMIIARQDQDSATLDRNERPLSLLRVSHSRHGDLRHGLRSLECSLSAQSAASMITSDTNDTTDLEVFTPRCQWDELPDFKDFGAYDRELEASKGSDILFDLRLTESSGIIDQSFGGVHGISTSSALGSSNFNLNSLPTQEYADRNIYMSAQFGPIKQAETPPKEDSRPQILSNASQWHKHSSYRPRSNCDEDMRIDVEAPPSSIVTQTIRNTMSGHDLTYYQQQASISSPTSVSSSETCSWSSENDTDCGDGEFDDERQALDDSFMIEGSNVLAEQGLSNFVTKPILSKMKQELVDRIMLEFWQIFNQEKENNTYEDTLLQSAHLHQLQEPETCPQDQQKTTQQSKSNTESNMQNGGIRPVSGENGKRKRQCQGGDDDDDENDETDNGNPKRPRGQLSPSRNQDDTGKFACPYRKHDARKYCVRYWRSCALTPLDTVARVKAHLYRHHRIFQCQRCKTLFNDQQEVSEHLGKLQGCELLEVEQQDGITSEIVDRLRSKKKAHRYQSEEDRWKEIYQILFPGEMVPSPFFEEIREDVIQSPDSRELEHYEEYCRRELPRIFRASLEEVVNNNTQPLEEQLKSRLIDLIHDAQDRVYSRYKSASPNTMGSSARGTPSSSQQIITSSSLSQIFPTSPIRSQPTIDSFGDRSRSSLPAFFQPPSPQNHLESCLNISDQDEMPSNSDRHKQSDSGYDSSSLAVSSKLPLTLSDFAINASASSTQTWSTLETSQETTNPIDSEFDWIQTKSDSNTRAIASNDSGPKTWEYYFTSDTSDFDINLSNLPTFDMNELRQYDSSKDLGPFSLNSKSNG